MKHKVESRKSPCSMGVQHRIIGPLGINIGPWVEGKPARAWKAYKKMRREQDEKLASSGADYIAPLDNLQIETGFARSVRSADTDEITIGTERRNNAKIHANHWVHARVLN